MLSKLSGAASAAFVYACMATVIAETIVVATMWQAGSFETKKVQKYAAVVYGFELKDLNIDGVQPTTTEQKATQSREQVLDLRVRDNATLVDRQSAIKKGADDVRLLVQALSTKRERYEIVKSGFNDLLVQLEQDVNDSAMSEVRRTLEVLRPKQTKDLMIAMLKNGDVTADDDVLDDVLVIIGGMPQDKLKKIFGEFKTEAEREELNRILLNLGELVSQ